MSDELLVRYSAPTLAGLKTGSLFSLRYGENECPADWICSLNRRLSRKGLCVLPLKQENRRVLIYIYRPAALKYDLSVPNSTRILSGYGYNSCNINACIRHLIRRIDESPSFPHEIGLFLGYPPEDVEGFITNHAAGFKAVGTWKVYGDVETAQEKFRTYSRCTQIYLREYNRGRSIELLTVQKAV